MLTAAGPVASGLDGPRRAAWPRSSSPDASLRQVGSTRTVSARRRTTNTRPTTVRRGPIA